MKDNIEDLTSDPSISWHLSQQVQDEIDSDVHLTDNSSIAKLYTSAEIYVLAGYIRHGISSILGDRSVACDWGRELTDLQTECLLHFDDQSYPISGLDRAMLRHTATRGAATLRWAEPPKSLQADGE